MGYVDSQDLQAARQAEIRTQQDEARAEKVAVMGELAERARGSLFGEYPGHRAHLDQVVYTDCTRRGVTNGHEIKAAQQKAWDELGSPAAREGASLELFKAVFAQERGVSQLTDAEVDKRFQTIVDFAAGTQAEKRSAAKAAFDDLQKRPALVKAMKAMGTENSVMAARFLVEERQKAAGPSGSTPSWLKRARESGGSILNPRTGPRRA